MITIKEIKSIRENLNLTHVVLFGVDNDGKHHVATHGENKIQSEEAATLGNSLKRALGWSEKKCNTKPLKRICVNCNYLHCGDRIIAEENNLEQNCMFEPKPIKRMSHAIACHNFDPKC